MSMHESKLSFSIPEFCNVTGLGRTNIFAAIRDGKLEARKFGRRTIIEREAGETFVKSLPKARQHDESAPARDLKKPDGH
jgi:excisionase family DNA binding protein